MGFRDFEDFNLALLAKLSWRIINHPNALWLKMLKGIYFHKNSFLEARKGCHPSWCWSSILAGRELLMKHLAWKSGDGVSVDVWNDRWVVGIDGLRLKCVQIP